jgi:hypothetical protein
MATRHRPIRPRTAAFVTAAALAACRLFGPAAQSAGTDTPGPAPRASPTAFAPGPADSPTPPAAPQVETPGQATGFHGLIVPGDWFFTPVETGDVAALVFTPLDPALLAAFEDPGWAVPPDFAIAALVRSPLPEGADPAALTAGIDASLASFSDADLASLLSGAGRIGLIDLTALETITLSTAERAEIGGRPAIAVRGEAGFGPDLEPALRLMVHLTWTDEAFLTYYALASASAWDANLPHFNSSLESIELP